MSARLIAGLGLSLVLCACATKSKRSVYEPTDSRDEIKKVVQSHMPEVKKCFDAVIAKAPALRGQVTATWTFDETGQVMDVDFKRVDPGLEPVTVCLAQRLRQWRFPLAAKGDFVEVSYPFLLIE